MALKVITGPASEPVSLTEAKLHCKVDDTADDALITALITAAREWCEGYSNRAYVTQTLELTLDGWPKWPVELPRPPLATVVSIKYFDTANTEATWANTNYFVDTSSEPGRVCMADMVTEPTTNLREINGVAIRYQAGVAAASVPKRVCQAILLLVGDWYKTRENEGVKAPDAVKALLGIDRVVPI